jgi:uncharacterized membrane protein YbhN (UPF0104 family)
MRLRLRAVLTFLFVVAAIGFLVVAMARQGSQLATYEWEVDPARLISSLAILIAVLVSGVGIWGYVLRQLDYRLRFRDLARIWFLSNLARYIPGKIWQFVGVAELSRSRGVPALIGVTSVAVFMGYVLLAAWVVGIYLLPAAALGPLAEGLTVVRVATPLLLALLHPGVQRGAIALVGRLTRQEFAPWKGGWRASLLLFAACVVLWIGFGAAFHLFVGSLTEVSPSQFPALTAVYAMAFLLSYVIVIAPAGLGAKEGVMAALLSSTFPLSVAAAVAVASRVWSTVAEVLPAIVVASRRTGDGEREGA